MMDKNLNQRVFPSGIQMIVLVLLIIICSMASSVLSILLEGQTNFSIASASDESLMENRSVLRIILFLSNAGMFLLPALLFSIFLYKKEWLKSVNADIFPSLKSIVIGTLTILCSIGLIAYSYHLNNLFPLPEWMYEAEQSSNRVLQAALHMNSPMELLACLFIIALVPAIGEEWIFRGILQDRLFKWVKNEHLAVWIIAFLFSAIHMQFQGFIPRMLLGAILGYMFVWSGSLWLPIIAHFFNNGIQVVMYYFTIKTGEEVDISQVPDVSWWQGLISFIIVLGLMVLLRRMCGKRDSIVHSP